MRIVFMGTHWPQCPPCGSVSLTGHEIVAVWTQPDKTFRPWSSRFLLTSEGICGGARLARLPAARIKNATKLSKLFASHDADVAVVVAYGRILPDQFSQAPRRGCINVHFSLLPFVPRRCAGQCGRLLMASRKRV
jgi:methionyl-tRNA formyltransferase